MNRKIIAHIKKGYYKDKEVAKDVESCPYLATFHHEGVRYMIDLMSEEISMVGIFNGKMKEIGIENDVSLLNFIKDKFSASELKDKKAYIELLDRTIEPIMFIGS